jgi:hypothetical protein
MFPGDDRWIIGQRQGKQPAACVALQDAHVLSHIHTICFSWLGRYIAYKEFESLGYLDRTLNALDKQIGQHTGE